MKAQQKDSEQHLDSLRAAANPSKEELQKIKELEKAFTSAELELLKLKKNSKSLRDKVNLLYGTILDTCLSMIC